jgi:hypothetical protein
MAVRPGGIRAIVLLVMPSGVAPGWDETDLRQMAGGIPGVEVISDRGGTEAARFGAQTSGQCFLFAADGRRLFSGGITASRGHEGDNAGRDALVALLTGRTPDQTSTPVFGCSLMASPSNATGVAQ